MVQVEAWLRQKACRRRRGAGRGELAPGREQAGEAGGADEHRQGQTLPEELHGEIAVADAVERSWHQIMAREDRLVPSESLLVLGPAIGEIEDGVGQGPARQIADGGEAVARPAPVSHPSASLTFQ
jgi:hypothetical protein